MDAPDSSAQEATPRWLFVRVPAASSGISFSNLIAEDPTQNYFIYEYLYNGGGVAIGDLNNDGLPDIYLTGNLMPDKVYLNKGDLKFEDITAQAITTGQEGWHTGVTMADVNNDGWLDIHVCRAGWSKDPTKRTNLFYVNNGDLTFTESAEKWGIADTTRSTQAAFFDMDDDGDLDLYVINTPMQGEHKLSGLQVAELIRTHRSPTDRLYRNEGDRFTDITAASGIWNMGYGLGLSISDLDGDGRPDIYVANDYIERDYMYMNKGDGRFVDEIKLRTRHISNFGMGCDIADQNNDGLPDILVLDMVSEDHVRSKKNMSSMSSDKFWRSVNAGYHYQYMANSLQVNNGDGTFSELAQLAGVARTDWSWAPLFADLDNDGQKDLIVTNGYKRDMRDNDYVNTAAKIQKEGRKVSMIEVLDLVPVNRIHNYAFRNQGDMTYADVSETWGLNRPVNSNGAAYADLDGDGDLDLVINNIDEPADLYENRAVQQGLGSYLQVDLEGRNTAAAIGSKVTIRTSDGEQTQELMPTRGYQSSVGTLLHFGLGKVEKVDQVVVHWPDGTVSEFSDVAAGKVLTVSRNSAKHAAPVQKEPVMFAEEAAQLGLLFTHQENPYDDFVNELLLPHKGSEYGPLMSTGDANGDRLDDLYIGGARGQAGVLFIQQANGRFIKAGSQPWKAHADREDMGSLFFDADSDGDQDLLVLSGSNETDMFDDQFIDRLYVNDGRGNFTYRAEALPGMMHSAMRACAADIDADGDQDLFIGGRIRPGAYPNSSRSYLLVNDGKGRFSDATEALGPALAEPGMITDCAFVDLEGDGDPDLVLVGEWMPVMSFTNAGGRFTNSTTTSGFDGTEGWWNSLTVTDLDGDGDQDLLCGNLGWNSKFHGTPDHPVHVYYNDFDGNGHGDIVLAKERKGTLVPVRGKECSSQQCPVLLDRFTSYDAFANADLGAIYGAENLSSSLHLQAKCMKSSLFLNNGSGTFARTDLPMAAQVSPVNGFAVLDVNDDGHLDVVLAGNHWGAEVETVRYDGGTGLLLLGGANAALTPVPMRQSGIKAWENAKDVALVSLGSGKEHIVVVSNNNGALQAFRPRPPVLRAAR